MKKTLIALAVAASAVVSGSAMAWTANGSGGSVEIGGALNPVDKVTPWEVATGAAVKNIDAQIQKTQSAVQVNVPKSVPVLAIRSVARDGFVGKAGISPQIEMGWIDGKWNVANSAVNGTVDLLNDAGAKIGKATLALQVVGVASKVGVEDVQYLMYAPEKGAGFYGGLPKTKPSTDIRPIIKAAWPDIDVNYREGAKWVPESWTRFDDVNFKFSAYYGSVVPENSKINMKLDTPASGDAPIKWKINLPVSVIYQ